jgi:hypothetical protein
LQQGRLKASTAQAGVASVAVTHAGLQFTAAAAAAAHLIAGAFAHVLRYIKAAGMRGNTFGARPVVPCRCQLSRLLLLFCADADASAATSSITGSWRI